MSWYISDYYDDDDNMANQTQYFDKIFNYSAQTAEHDDSSVISSEPTNVCFVALKKKPLVIALVVYLRVYDDDVLKKAQAYSGDSGA